MSHFKDMLAILLGQSNAGHLSNFCVAAICSHSTVATRVLNLDMGKVIEPFACLTYYVFLGQSV